MNTSMKHKAAFFDRDGTLIKDVPYLSRCQDVELLPEAVRIAQELSNNGYLLFVITNQSGVARGLYDEACVHAIHAHIAALFAQHGVTFTRFYFCPHHPTEAKVEKYRINCACRKPKPGLIIQAAHDYHLDLTQSVMLGNEERDVQAGRAAGCCAYDITKLFTSSPEHCAKL
ncbi:MAG: HAD family hydrolase [Candidatus Babeliales bacterium]